jgi:invasion protein IalB
MRGVRKPMAVLAFTAVAFSGFSGLNAQASTRQGVTRVVAATVQSPQTECGRTAIGDKCKKWQTKCSYDKQHHKHCKRVCVKKH